MPEADVLCSGQCMREPDYKEMLDQILQLEMQSAKHREDLLNKYSEHVYKLNDLIAKSEARVDAVNKMVTDMVKLMERACEQNATSQKIVMRLTDAIDAKERRMQRLEECLDELKRNNDNLLTKYTDLALLKGGSTNYNIHQNN